MRSFLLVLVALVTAAAGEIKLGKPFTIDEFIGIDKLMTHADRYVGRVVQVKGTVRDVCRAMGCWMELADIQSGKHIRVKVRDGEIVFPKEAIGKTAIAEGTLEQVKLTREQAVAQAKHEAEANGRKFDPESISADVTYYQIKGTGAVIFE
jgi:hypothetical protein